MQEVSKSAKVELLAVVWEVRESVYISSPSLSSSPDMDSGKDWNSHWGGFWISRGICHHRGLLLLGGTWLWFDGTPRSLLGALATLGITSTPSSSSSEPEMPSPSVPPGLPDPTLQGSKRLLWRTLVLPPATLFTVYTGTPPGTPHSPSVLDKHFPIHFLVYIKWWGLTFSSELRKPCMYRNLYNIM